MSAHADQHASLSDVARDEISSGLFFVIGTGRCGSTLLQRMLTAHPKLFIPPETQFFARFDPMVVVGQDPVADSDVDRYVRRVTGHPWFEELGFSGDEFRAAVGRGMRSADEILVWMLRSLDEQSVGTRFGEKSPMHEKFIGRIRDVFPDARFIHIHRDPRDVVASLRKEAWSGDGSVLRMAHHCRKVLRRQSAAATALGSDRYLAVSYEELISDTEDVLRRVCDFLGETFAPEMLRYHEQAARGFVESEREWKELTNKSLDQSRIGRYRSLLSAREIRSVEHAMGDALGKYGYRRESDLPDPLMWRLGDAMERLGWVFSRYARSIRKRFSGGHD